MFSVSITMLTQSKATQIKPSVVIFALTKCINKTKLTPRCYEMSVAPPNIPRSGVRRVGVGVNTVKKQLTWG